MNTQRADESDPLRTRVRGVVESYGLELFDLQFRRESQGWVLRVVIDRPWDESRGEPQPLSEAVGIEDCSRVSQDLNAILDVEPELIGGLDRKYILEVSSPGLDRALREERDYRRFAGRLAKIVTSAPLDGQSAFSGRLAGVTDGVVLVTEGSRTHRVPLDAIKRARLEVEF